MKFKKILLITLLLLAVFTISAVSAANDNATVDNIATEEEGIPDDINFEDTQNLSDVSPIEEDTVSNEYDITVPDKIYVGHRAQANFTCPSDFEGTLFAGTGAYDVKNGKATIFIDSDTPGTYDEKYFFVRDYFYKGDEFEDLLDLIDEDEITYVGNFNYTSSIKNSEKIDINLPKLIYKNTATKITFTGPSNLKGKVTIGYYDEEEGYPVEICDDDYDPARIYDDEGYSVAHISYVKGKATASIKFFNTGVNNLWYHFKSSDSKIRYTVPFNVTVLIKPKKPTIIASEFTTDYSSTKKYQVRIKDADGKYVGAGKTVTFELHRVLYTENNKDKTVKVTTKSVKTDKNGYAKVHFNVASDTYKVKIKYGGATVNKYYYVQSIINSKNIFKTAKKIVIPISLNKVDGKYLKGKKIKITFCRQDFDKKGNTIWKPIKSYTKKTNKKGAVKFTFNKSPIKISSDDYGLGFTVIISYSKDKTDAVYTQYSKNPFKYHWEFF